MAFGDCPIPQGDCEKLPIDSQIWSDSSWGVFHSSSGVGRFLNFRSPSCQRRSHLLGRAWLMWMSHRTRRRSSCTRRSDLSPYQTISGAQKITDNFWVHIIFFPTIVFLPLAFLNSIFPRFFRFFLESSHDIHRVFSTFSLRLFQTHLWNTPLNHYQ